MGESKSVSKIKIDVDEMVTAISQLPTVHVNREDYLRAEFAKYCSPQQIELILMLGPVEAGISARRVNQMALAAIKHETGIAAALSAAAGLPGGWGLAVTIPADLAQFHAGILRVSQKLAYLHGWPDLFKESGKGMDDDTKGVMLLFMGVMYGIRDAGASLTKLSTLITAHVEKQIFKQPLTQTWFYPAVKAVLGKIGIKVNKSVFSKAVAGGIPIVGALISGTLTWVTFDQMAVRLHEHLRKMSATKRRLLKTQQLPK
jgi:hypothetical protein